ncbi:MAG TPA: hypothetical protein VMZ74_13610 [Ramlibacter sp.]|nr:hypothetical protein [Ramlibacter sp.]
MLTTYASFAFTVILLVWMGFFTLGSLPLMILKHDTLLDARFIRGLFDVYYKAVMVTSTAGTVSYSLAGRAIPAVVMAIVFTVAFFSRRAVLPRMDALRAREEPMELPAIRKFRQLHVTGMLLNITQLLSICFGMAKFGLS